MSNSWWQWVFCFKKVFPQELPHERPAMTAMLSVCSFSFLASLYVNSQAITLPGGNFSLTSTQDPRLSSFGEFSETYRLVLNKKWNAPEKLTYFQTFFNKLNFNYFTIFWLTEQSKKNSNNIFWTSERIIGPQGTVLLLKTESPKWCKGSWSQVTCGSHYGCTNLSSSHRSWKDIALLSKGNSVSGRRDLTTDTHRRKWLKNFF